MQINYTTKPTMRPQSSVLEDMGKTRRESLREAVRNGAKIAIASLLRPQEGQSTPVCQGFGDGFCDLLMSEAIDSRKCAVVELLIQHGFRARGEHQDMPHLHRAITGGSDDIIKLLVHSGADVRARNEVTGKTSLHIVTASGIGTSCGDILDFLIVKSRDNVSCSDTGLSLNLLEIKDKVQGNTALHVACAYNNETAAMCLLRHGAEPNPLNFHGDTPLARLLQPVTRKADDFHNRSRLGLARRLVAFGMVVEKKHNRGRATSEDMRVGIVCGSGNGKVTIGSGSARVKNGPENGKVSNVVGNGTDNSGLRNENVTDVKGGRLDMKRTFDDVKAKSDSVKMESKCDYTKTLGISHGKEKSHICRDLTGLQGYAASDVSDSFGAVRGRSGCGRGLGSACMLKASHLEPRSRAEVEAQLEALGDFQSTESSESESPTFLRENVAGKKDSAANSLHCNEVTPKTNLSGDLHLSRVRTSRNTTNLEPETSQKVPKHPQGVSCGNALRIDTSGAKARETFSRESDRPELSHSVQQNVTVTTYKLREMLSLRPQKHSYHNATREYMDPNHMPARDKNFRILPITDSLSSESGALTQNKQNACDDGQRDLTFLNSQRQTPTYSTPSRSSQDLDARKSDTQTKRAERDLYKSADFLQHQNNAIFTKLEAVARTRNDRVHSSSRGMDTNVLYERLKPTPSPSIRVPLQEIRDISPKTLNSTYINRNQGTASTETSLGVNSNKDRFRFPSRDERVRLRFKRLLGELSATLTLQQLCRLAILRSLTGKSVAESIDKLGLPVLMQNFLLRDDLF